MNAEPRRLTVKSKIRIVDEDEGLVFGSGRLNYLIATSPRLNRFTPPPCGDLASQISLIDTPMVAGRVSAK